MRERVAQIIAALPVAPGVYLMKNEAGEIFYIGKAKSLRDRVRSYFSGSDTRPFVAYLDTLLSDLEVVLTHTEKEALLLENELVKKHQPRFNVELKDDKRFLCLRLDTRTPYPRLQIVRSFGKDGARYFGPFHSASSIREAVRIINRHFQLRTCTDHVMNNRSRPCLQYQIHRCPAPCVFDLSGGAYAENVEAVTAFLLGKIDRLLADLRARMATAAEGLEFERAAQLRDQIAAVERSMERQRVVNSDFANRDIVGMYREGPAVEMHVTRVREGKLIDAARFSLSGVEIDTPDVLAELASRYYGAMTSDFPDEILFPEAMEWGAELEAVLTERRGRAVRVLLPRRGDKRRLVELAERNAKQAFIDQRREEGAARTALEKLQRALHLPGLPERMECVDISHFQGGQIVASVVRFEQGVPQKDGYRHYRIRSTATQDDFKSIYEVVSRRARRGLEDGDLPDLLVIDGGKGQLGAARAALSDHGIAEIGLVGLAKSRVTNPGETDEAVARSPERVFVEGQKNPVVLGQSSAALFLLVRIRDEAHRFAIQYQRRKQRQRSTASALDGVPGVGPKRRRALLRTFGSVDGVRAAEPDDLARVVGAKVAAQLVKYLGNDPKIGETSSLVAPRTSEGAN